MAIICSINKKGYPQGVSNYRPVSSTSIKCKILERILKRAVLSVLSDTRSIPSHQHVFLPRRSSLSNLQVFKGAVTRMMDEGHTFVVVYLDFAQAFDSVNHICLLAKSFGHGDVVVR